MVEEISDPRQCSCTVCHKTLSLPTSARVLLTEHASEVKHKDALDKRQKFFKPISKNVSPVSWNTDSEFSLNLPPKSKQLNLDSAVTTSGVILAERRWVLKTIVNGYSINYLNDISETFTVMFPDSKIASQMRLKRTKASYVDNFGIANFLFYISIESWD